MRIRQALLFTFLVLPGACAVVVSGYYLFQDWAVLISAFAKFERAVASDADLRAVYVAGQRDMIFRTNCFADGVGVMLGAILFGIGLHGLCTFPRRDEPGEVPVRRAAGRGTLIQVLPAIVASLAAAALFASLVERVGETNALRRAVVRGDTAAVRALVVGGADVNDRLWWGSSPLNLAREESQAAKREEMIRLLREAGAR